MVLMSLGMKCLKALLDFLDKKVAGIVDSTRVNPGFYNGSQKIHAESLMFIPVTNQLVKIKWSTPEHEMTEG